MSFMAVASLIVLFFYIFINRYADAEKSTDMVELSSVDELEEVLFTHIHTPSVKYK